MKAVIAAITVILLSGQSAHANERAIWDQYPTLVCRYGTVIHCDQDLSSCRPAAGQAVITIDFKNGTVSTVGTNGSRPIISKQHFDTHGNGFGDANVALSDYSLYSFNEPIKSTDGRSKDLIIGYFQSAWGGSVSAVKMTCYPP